MKTQSPQSLSVFRGHRSSPPLSWQVPSDFMEVLLRVLLVLCLILSLVLCGLRISAGSGNFGSPQPLLTPSTAQVTCTGSGASAQTQGS
jgi:hypothetical protein